MTRPSEAGSAERPSALLFVLRNLGYVRLFDGAIRLLLERGHRVHLLVEREVGTERELAWLDRLESHPGFSATFADPLARDRWHAPATKLRRFADALYYLGPGFRGVPPLVAKAVSRVDPRLRPLLRSPILRVEPVRRTLYRALLLAEAAIPSSRALEAELRRLAPDALVLVPHLMPGNRHSEYVKAARAVGLPTCMCIASWDNLTSKQQIREIPDRVVVWNDVQRREAVELHGVPAGRIVVTGAQSFDEWFEREAGPRERFCARVGLDPARPYVLYLGGALFPGALTEARFVREVWIPALQTDERLGATGILVRPHPRRLEEWDAVSFDGLDGVAVWPRTGAGMPVDEESRADFFDSIASSAAVVGLNTTAMIEAAIVGRPVHTVLVPEFAESQTGTSHFDYLRSVGGGFLHTAGSLEEHVAQLAAALAGMGPDAEERRRRFLTAFVRPHGLEQPVLPLAVAAIEETPLLARAPQRPPLRLLPVRLALTAALAAVRLVRRVSPASR